MRFGYASPLKVVLAFFIQNLIDETYFGINKAVVDRASKFQRTVGS